MYNASSPDAGGVNDAIPKAYLTVLFFDERFNFIGEGSATDRVDAPGNGSDRVLVIDPVKAPRNGYAFVYLSNESDEHVYFDNLKVQLRHGHIIEENHYYAYGLRIAGISSRKMGDLREGHLQNPYQYQGDYSEYDDETGWNDFALRSYDPQTGRFINADPYDQFASVYVGMGNDPVNNTDPSGGWAGGSFVQDFALKHFMPAMAGAVVGAATTGGDFSDKLRGAAFGFGIGMAASYAATEINWGSMRNLSIGLKSGSFTLNMKLMFNTADDAALHWGYTYNDNSIADKTEYGSTIYEVKVKGKLRYAYSDPYRGKSPGGKLPSVSPNPKETKAVADIHSHGNSWGEDPGIVSSDNNFSDTDKWGNIYEKRNGYVTTPDGSLKKYEYRTREEFTLCECLSSDPKYPKLRKTSISPYIQLKGEPSQLHPSLQVKNRYMPYAQ